MLEVHIIYGLAWLSFGLGHSILANPTVKQRLEPIFGPYNRLVFNIVASAHILGVWLIGRWIFGDPVPLALPEAINTALLGLVLLGAMILALALREYDLGIFAGTAQIRNHKRGLPEIDSEPLQTGGLHAYVRHPIYLGAYLILWGGAQNDLGLATAIWGSLYLYIGTKFEERSLIKTYGDHYRDYQDKVPTIFPWRGKVI